MVNMKFANLVFLYVATGSAQHLVSDSLPNANHIFNAIHSSMRQFGSSLNHNGMSLFIATVAPGIELYHGTYTPYRVNDTEWLAFEPEHAMLFAGPRRGPPGKRPGHESAEKRPIEKSKDRSRRKSSRTLSAKKKAQEHATDHVNVKPTVQVPLSSDSGIYGDQRMSGYLHTYRTKHSLRLLYTDGQSAAKSRKGTLDVQDMIITNSSIEDNQPMFGDKERAEEMCRVAHEEWNDRIDGILRMEGGFEIILCSFKKHLDLTRITESSPRTNNREGNYRDRFNYYRAVAARYDGIGDSRVTLDYDHFATMFAHPEAIYFDGTGRPRVNNESEELVTIRQELTSMVVQSEHSEVPTDWQAVIDMYITRYAERLEYLASGDLTTESELKEEVDLAIRPFVDYGARNASLETERCVMQPWPAKSDDSTTAPRAIRQVVQRLCSTLASFPEIEGYEKGLSAIRELTDYLAWTTWKRCRNCKYNEVCFLPIWPVGRATDFEQPTCRSDPLVDPGHGDEQYWNDWPRSNEEGY